MKTKNILFALCLLALCPGLGRAQIIETVAGNGGHTYNGDSLAATATAFQPVGLAFSPKGELYFSTWNNFIRKVTLDGTVVTIAGSNQSGGFNGNGRPAKTALMEQPWGLAFDAAGNLYVCDMQNNQIRKIDTFGMMTLVAGLDTVGVYGGGYNGDSLPATQTRLAAPTDLLIEADNSIVFTEYDNNVIRRIKPDGTVSSIAGTGHMGYYVDGNLATTQGLAGPAGLAQDKYGNIYFCDGYSSRVAKVDTLGMITTLCGKLDSSGTSGDGGPASAGKLISPADIKIDAVGNIYISDPYSAKIRLIDTGLILHTYAGIGYAGYSGDGIPATSAELNFPAMMTFDTQYNLYLADMDNCRIRTINNTEAVREVSSNAFAFRAYPNPVMADGSFYVLIPIPVSENALLQLTDIAGIPVLLKSIPLGFDGQMPLYVPYRGVYFLTLFDQTSSSTIKIIY